MNIVYVTKIHAYVTTNAFINVSQLSLQEDILDFNVHVLPNSTTLSCN